MPIIEWNDSLSVRVDEIDQQHKRLIAMINTLGEAHAQGGGQEVLEGVVREFNRYTLEHFAAEEKLMDRYRYPGYADHIEQHMTCSFRAMEFFKGYITGREELAGELLDYLVDWFTAHIGHTDRKLGAFLNDQGLF